MAVYEVIMVIQDNDMEPTVDEILAAVNCALEDENRHSESTGTWDAVAPFISSKKHLEAVRAYADALASGWEYYLENVMS